MAKKLFLSSMLLLLVVVIGLKQEQNASWIQYQNAYFAQQISLLQDSLKKTEDTQTRIKIQQEISDWETRVPEIINLVLPYGKVERCKTCHIGIEEISASHPSNTFGCAVCHGGNPLSLNQEIAHANMYGQGHPGLLSVASQSCGTTGLNGMACHSQNPDLAQNEVDLVKSSIMSTKSGELSSVRFMFGLDHSKDVPNLTKGEVAQDYPNPLAGRVQEQGFQDNCLSMCHLNGGKLPAYASDTPLNQQENANPQNAASGCETCHVLTNPGHTYTGSDTTMQEQTGYGMVHRLTTQIPYTQCNQCHNQGQHDSLNMKFTSRSDLAKVVEDWSKGGETWADCVADYYVPGEVFARCEVSLDCIDCHTRQDVMGDSQLWTSEYDAVHIQCLDCHGTTLQLPQTKTILSLDDPAFEEKITSPVFPDLKVGDQIVVTTKGEEMPFIRNVNEKWILFSRVNGQSFNIPLVQGSNCQQNPAEQGADSCHKCHSESNLHQ